MHLNLLLSPSSVSVIAWSWGNLSAVAIREAFAGHENQVKFISEPDHGMYEAINKGIRMATGDVIALCHLKVAYLHVDEADENGMESAAIHSSEIHEVVFRIP